MSPKNSAERWKQVKEIFDEAVELPTAERPKFLDNICKIDLDLRQAVEKMLVIDDEASSFLEESPLERLEKSEPDELLNQHLGSYKLLQEIGRGGMGRVFLAERDDAEFKKQVAVKIVKRGMDTDDILRRFRHERQILARLEHPNIAHLIDGGTTADGLPYFVMEYVEGEDIITYSDSNNLTVNERLKLFCEVCSAVQFAHQNLVVHRDLKPSNIVINQNKTPKLLDFGIAKLLTADENSGTVTSLGIMTPAYASPEQANGKNVTTATDVYSLGVILYELLTGQMPYKFDSNNPNKMAQVISSTEPQKPSLVVYDQWSVVSKELKNPKSKIQNPKSLRGDLDNIVLMALHKDVERRYISVEQFSEDIRRYLANLPVLAQADTIVYRAAKFIRRNRVGVMAAIPVFLLILGGIVSTWRQARIAENERQLAEERFNEVRELANNVVFKYHDEIKNLPGSTKVRQMLVTDALNYLDRLAQNSSSNPNLQRELARAYMKVGDVQGEVYNANTGDTAGAIESYRKAVGLLEMLQNQNLQKEIGYLNELNSANRGLGLLLMRAGDLTSAGYLKKALTISQQLFEIQPSTTQRVALIRTQISVGDTIPKVTGEGSRKEIYREASLMAEELFRAEPENAEVIRVLATVSSRLGHIISVLANNYLTIEKETAQKLYQESEIYQKNAVRLTEKLAASDAQNTTYQRSLMVARLDLSETERELGQIESAFKTESELYREINTIIQSDPANLESKADKSDVCDALGTTNLKLGKYPQSIEKYKEALSLLEQNITADKGNLELKARRYKIEQHLADALLSKGEAESAILQYQTSFDSLYSSNPNKEGLIPWQHLTNEKVGDAYFYLAAKPNTPKEKKIKFLNLAKEQYEIALQAQKIQNLPPTLFGENGERLKNIEKKLAKCLGIIQTN